MEQRRTAPGLSNPWLAVGVGRDGTTILEPMVGEPMAYVQGYPPKGHLWTLPGTQGKSSNSSAAIVVRCSHLSGLSMRSNRPRARMGFADRSQNTGARSKRSTFTGLSDPVRLTNSPYYPLTFFTSSKRLSAMPLPPKLCNCCLSSSSPRRCAPSC